MFWGEALGEITGEIMGGLDELFTSDEEKGKLENAKEQIKLSFKKLEAKLEIAYLKDTQSARNMLMKLSEDRSLIKWAPVIMSVLITLGFFSMLVVVFTAEIPQAQRELAYLLLGTLASGFTSVVAFWLGSSHGSKVKTQQMAFHKAAEKSQENPMEFPRMSEGVPKNETIPPRPSGMGGE